jgi:hypothetical protein
MATTSLIPKPEFSSCDETSLKFVIKYLTPPNHILALQYKEPHEGWEVAREVNITNDEVKIADVVDLKPGTPYFVRIAVINNDLGTRQFGPETVFDTKPVDCTPKKRRCIIS